MNNDIRKAIGLFNCKVTPLNDNRELKTGVILNTETTGFDSRKDKIIELTMLKFLYDDDGVFIELRIY